MSDKPSTPGSPGTDDTFVPLHHSDRAGQGRFVARIDRYLRTLYASGEDAEDRHAKALDELRREPGETVVALVKAAGCCNSRDYPRRWALVYAATRLEHDAALPYFRELVLTPLPPTERQAAHVVSAAREETILRTTAIEGVRYLAKRGNKKALDALLEFLEVPSISIRRASIQAILSVAPGLRDRVAERLPRDLRYLLKVRTVPVTKVPQVRNPKKHLRERSPLRIPSPPVITEEGPHKQPRRRSPKLGGK